MSEAFPELNALKNSLKLTRNVNPLIYLDWNATAPLRNEALLAMQPFLSERFANPSSLHTPGQQTAAALFDARKRCAAALQCQPEELVFTSGGTEGDNLALRGLAWARRLRNERARKILVCKLEHPAVRETIQALQRQGFEPYWIEVRNDGTVSRDDFEAQLKRLPPNEIALATLMLANNETGVVQPSEAVAALCSALKVPFHCDAVQTVGKLDLSPALSNCDTMAFSAHKFGGPKGVGLLFVRQGTELEAAISGGSQEEGRRGGTGNVAGAVGLATALELAIAERIAMSAHLERLTRQWEAAVLERIPACCIHGATAFRLPGTSFIGFAGIDAASLVNALDLEGIACSTGAACSEGTHRNSPVLEAMRVPQELATGAVRFSFGSTTTQDEVETAFHKLSVCVKRLRARSAKLK